MRKIFVINETQGDRLALAAYGTVVAVCPGWIDSKAETVNNACRLVVETLKDQYKDGDLIVLGGHGKLSYVAFHHILCKHLVLRQLLPKAGGWFQLKHEHTEEEEYGREWFIAQ